MSDGKSDPLFDTIMKQKLLNKNVFAFYMAMNNVEDSELVFGWYDESKIEGPLIWYPVVNKLFWSIKLDDI